LHKTTPGLRSHYAVCDSLQGETLSAGPVDGAMPLRGGCEGASGKMWIGVTGSGAEDAGNDLLSQSGNEA